MKVVPKKAVKKFTLTREIKAQLLAEGNKLEALPEERVISIPRKGSELIQAGILNVKSKGVVTPVQVGKEYKQPVSALYNVNHHSKLKQAYTEQGISGVISYISLVFEHAVAMKAMYPQLFEKGKFKGVIDGTVLKPVVNPTQTKSKNKPTIIKQI